MSKVKGGADDKSMATFRSRRASQERDNKSNDLEGSTEGVGRLPLREVWRGC